MLNSISKKVMVGYIGIILVLVVTSVLLYAESTKILTQKETFVQEVLPTLRSVEQAATTLNKIQIAAYELYGTTLELPDFNREVSQYEAALDSKLNELRQARMGNTSDLQQQRDAVWQQVNRLKAIMGADRVDWDGAREALAAIQVQMQQVQDSLTQVKSAVSRNAEVASDNISTEIFAMRGLILFTVIAISGITFFSFLGAQRGIAKPVKALSKQLDRIVVEHDLSKDIDIRSSDEVGGAANSVNELLVAFRSGNQDIQRSAAVLVDSVSQLNHSAKVSEDQVNKFTTYISELLHNISSLETSIEDSANRSASASSTALTGADQVHQGADSVAKTSSSISALAEDVERSAEMLLSLKNAGDQVSSVVKTIAEIAEQTNLLALNAAIEAARAGESGRGFAVVADEVRTLASRTHDSTHEINTILDSIVASITSTVTSMDSNKAKATESVELAQATVASLETIQETILRLSDENSELANLGQDIRANASAMRTSIDHIQDASEQVTQSSQETRSASTSLSELSQSLSDIANQFKV